MQRFYSSIRGVTNSRNVELLNYQKKLKLMRQSYQQQFSMLPTKLQQAEQLRQESQQRRLEKWQDYLQRIKGQLDNPKAEINKDRHSCRPVIEHIKADEDRQINRSNMSRALGKYQIVRRKCLIVLDSQLRDIITKGNLDSRIQKAIANPVNFNISTTRLVDEELSLRQQLKSIKINRDKILYQCSHLPNQSRE